MTDSTSPQTSAAYATRRPGARISTAMKCLTGVSLIALAGVMCRADNPTEESYPTMAPLERYLMPRDAEIALARSAAPEAITRDAEILVLGPQGYETAVPGHNGFVCAVDRLWSSPSDAKDYWNPKGRGAICWNPIAARYIVPRLIELTKLVLAGKSKAEIKATMKAEYDAGKVPPVAQGAMCYMMSQESHLNDQVGHWHPHMMFFLPVEQASTWGANVPGSPVFGLVNDLYNVTIFMVPVRRWSNGAPDQQLEGACVPIQTPAASPLPPTGT